MTKQRKSPESDKIPFMTTTLSIAAVWRYPVKGLGGELLGRAGVLAGRGICGDRRWMFAASDVSPLLAGKKEWRPWNYGPTLKRDARLASMRASLHNGELKIETRDGNEVCADPENENGRQQIEKFARDFLGDNSLFLADCERRPVWDDANTPLTVLFSESLADLSRHCKTPLAAERFRANVVINGGAAWDEMRNIGGDFCIGDKTILTATEGVDRCAATRVNPQTEERDINIPEMLVRHYHRNEMGIKCAVRCGGEIVTGDCAAWK